MGSKCCKNDNYRTEILCEIQNLNFNDQESEFPLEQRAMRELMLDTKTIYQLQICLKKFLLENAYLIKERKLEVKDNGILAQITPPPLLDLIWQIAILYSQQYIKICKKLVGCVIDREYRQENVHQTILKKMLPEFDDTMFSVEYEYTIWVKRCELEQIMIDLHQNILCEEVITFEYMLSLMMQVKLDLCKAIGIGEQRQITDLLIKKSLESIQQALPSDLELILMHKYCLNQATAKLYLIEYSHFMAMLKVSKTMLVPSDEVDQVWHTHQCMTKQYRQFCFLIFQRFIHHNPSNNSNQQSVIEGYTLTLKQYQKIFGYSPHSQIWPKKEDRWNPQQYLGSWINLFRLCMSIIQVVQDKMVPNTSNILQRYQYWKGCNVFKQNPEIRLDTTQPLKLALQQNGTIIQDVGCYSLNELEQNQFIVGQRDDGIFCSDDVIINSIN